MELVTAETLNSAVEFDSPFTIGHTDDAGLTTIERADGVYAPEVTLYVDKDGNGVGEETIDGTPWKESKRWEAVNGYSGQHGYSGPVMHASELLGGTMARDVLADKGTTYVIVSVECLPDWEVDQDDDDDVLLEMTTLDNPAGWMLLKLKEGN